MSKIPLFYWLLISFPVFATQQINDTFIFNGKEYEIEVMPYGKSPLESLYSFDEILIMLQSDRWCSANWRGYKGTWEVKNDQLYLTKLVKGACDKNPPLVNPELVFGESNYPIKATWFNDTINIRLSERTPIYCGEEKSIDQTIGSGHDAKVYEFSSGDLIHKFTLRIEDVWENNANKCKAGKL